MKKLFVLFSLIPALVFGQQNIKQVLTNGNNAGGKSLIGASLIGLNGATSGTVTVKGPAVITTYTFSLPANAGTSGYVLQTNGSGVTSWVAAGLTVGSTAIASGTSGRVLYDNAGTLGEKVVWNIDGNASTTASTDFIGTTDAVNFRIQRNGLVGAVFKSSGDIFIGNKGSGYMYFDYANARLGIQDSTPARIFVINGSGANNYPRLNTDASHDMFLEWSVGGTAKGYLGTHNNDAYVQFSNPLGNIIQTWSTSNEDVFFPDADGVVGLGVTSASAKLHVKGSGATAATNTALFESINGDNSLFIGDDNFVAIGDATAPVDGFSTLTVQRTGNVGIEFLDANNKGLRIRNTGANTSMQISGVNSSQDGSAVIVFKASANADPGNIGYGNGDIALYDVKHSFFINSVGTTDQFAVSDLQTRATNGGANIYLNGKSSSGSVANYAKIKSGATFGSVNTGQYLSFEVSNVSSVMTERMRIDSVGRIAFNMDSSTTTGDAATINAATGFFTKDATGTTFTLTNNNITDNSRIFLQLEGALGVTGNQVSPTTIATGSAVITFYTTGTAAAPAANQRVAFWIVNNTGQ